MPSITELWRQHQEKRKQQSTDPIQLALLAFNKTIRESAKLVAAVSEANLIQQADDGSVVKFNNWQHLQEALRELDLVEPEKKVKYKTSTRLGNSLANIKVSSNNMSQSTIVLYEAAIYAARSTLNSLAGESKLATKGHLDDDELQRHLAELGSLTQKNKTLDVLLKDAILENPLRWSDEFIYQSSQSTFFVAAQSPRAQEPKASTVALTP